MDGGRVVGLSARPLWFLPQMALPLAAIPVIGCGPLRFALAVASDLSILAVM